MFTRSRKQILQILLLIYVVFWLIDAIFLNKFSHEDLTNSYTLGTVFITVAACFYFIEMLNRDVVMHITSSPYFWVSFGLLVYCLTYLPFEVAITFMVKENLIIWSVVLFIINSLQYCCFAIAFVKTHKSYREHLINPNE